MQGQSKLNDKTCENFFWSFPLSGIDIQMCCRVLFKLKTCLKSYNSKPKFLCEGLNRHSDETGLYDLWKQVTTTRSLISWRLYLSNPFYQYLNSQQNLKCLEIYLTGSLQPDHKTMERDYKFINLHVSLYVYV